MSADDALMKPNDEGMAWQAIQLPQDDDAPVLLASLLDFIVGMNLSCHPIQQ